MMDSVLHKEFVAQMSAELGDHEAALLVDALMCAPQPTSVRYNPHKVSPLPEGEVVPWCAAEGRYLPTRPSFTLDPHFQAGRYYVQEAASMFVGHLLVEALGGEIPQGVRVLDMCAAPGGKTTLYSALVGDRGVVVANEVIRTRALTLADNVMRWGVGNTVVTSNDPSHFGSLEGWFDVVAVDAPCSGEGMFRKSEEARREWSPDNVRLCAARQRRIVADAWKALRPGGVLLYSTCTFNRTENEENMEWLTEEFECEHIGVECPEEWGIVRTLAGVAECFHFYPHRTSGEGLFAAVVRKAGEGGGGRSRSPKARKSPFGQVDRQAAAVVGRYLAAGADLHLATIGESLYAYPAAHWNDVRTVCEQMSVLYSGVRVGEVFGKKFKPDHALALSTIVNSTATPTTEVSLDDALRYFRREELGCVGELAEGVNLLLFEGAPIGYTKRIGGRTNSLMPKELRIFQQQ